MPFKIPGPLQPPKEMAPPAGGPKPVSGGGGGWAAFASPGAVKPTPTIPAPTPAPPPRTAGAPGAGPAGAPGVGGFNPAKWVGSLTGGVKLPKLPTRGELADAYATQGPPLAGMLGLSPGSTGFNILKGVGGLAENPGAYAAMTSALGLPGAMLPLGPLGLVGLAGGRAMLTGGQAFSDYRKFFAPLADKLGI